MDLSNLNVTSTFIPVVDMKIHNMAAKIIHVAVLFKYIFFP